MNTYAAASLMTPISSYNYIHTEAKSQTIRRMQSSLETWDKQLEEIVLKKSHNGLSERVMKDKYFEN